MKTLIFNGSPRKHGDTVSLINKVTEKLKPIAKAKKGAVLLVGGGDGNTNKAFDTACCLLHHMNAYNILPAVISHNTNDKPAIEDEAALSGVNGIAKYFNESLMKITIEREDINSSEAKELIDELSEELKSITGSSGRGSFDNIEMDNPRSLFVIARE